MWIRVQGPVKAGLPNLFLKNKCMHQGVPRIEMRVSERTRRPCVFQFVGQRSPGHLDAFLRWVLAGSHNIRLVCFPCKQLEYFPAAEFLIKIG